MFESKIKNLSNRKVRKLLVGVLEVLYLDFKPPGDFFWNKNKMRKEKELRFLLKDLEDLLGGYDLIPEEPHGAE